MMPMKKLLSLLLALTLIMSAAVPAYASENTEETAITETQAADTHNATTVASGTCGDNVTWVLDENGTLTISGMGPMWNYLFMEDLENGKIMRYTTPWEEDYSSDIINVVIEPGVSCIGACAFTELSAVKSVRLPKGLEEISSYAFMGCTGLTSIAIPEGVTVIGRNAFAACSSLTSVTIPASLTGFEGDAFAQSDNISEVYISDLSAWLEISFPDIACNPLGENFDGGNIYLNGELLTDVVVPEGKTRINSFAFVYCNSLNSIVIPQSVTSIGEFAFGYCANLKDVTLSKGLNTIARFAFEGCKSLGSITIPNSVTTIGDGAFQNSGIKSIIIPSSVTNWGEYIFNSCYELIHVSLPNNFTTIKNMMFARCTSLESITLPNTVTSIGDEAFGACHSLSNINIPNGVTSIGDSAFWNCDSLTNITMPSGLKSIGKDAFGYCEKLSKIYFTGDAPAIGENAFAFGTSYGDIAYHTAYYPASNPTWTSDVMQDYGGDITWVPYNASVPAVPAKPYKIANVVSGVHVYWKAVAGAGKYGVWRSETGKNGTYKWLANPTVPHFTDTTAVSGKTYYYKITSMNTISGKHSDKSEALGITFVSTPDISSRENTSQGIKLGWQKISGATGYAIYRKVGTNDWKRVATIEGGSTLSWLDTAVKSGNGTTYKYTIRALYGTTLSGCRNTGRTMVRLFTPTVSTAVPHDTKANTVFIRWNKNSAAHGYEVRFLLNGKVAKTVTVGNINTVARSFDGLTEGKTYTVQVRSYFKTASAGTYYSAWSTAKSVTV